MPSRDKMDEDDDIDARTTAEDDAEMESTDAQDDDDSDDDDDDDSEDESGEETEPEGTSQPSNNIKPDTAHSTEQEPHDEDDNDGENEGDDEDDDDDDEDDDDDDDDEDDADDDEEDDHRAANSKPREVALRPQTTKKRRTPVQKMDIDDNGSVASTVSAQTVDSLSPPPDDAPPASLAEALEHFRANNDIAGFVAWQGRQIDEQTNAYKAKYAYLRRVARKKQARQNHADRLVADAVRRARTVPSTESVERQKELLMQMADSSVAERAALRFPLEAYIPSRPRGRAHPADVQVLMAKGPRSKGREGGWKRPFKSVLGPGQGSSRPGSSSGAGHAKHSRSSKSSGKRKGGDAMAVG